MTIGEIIRYQRETHSMSRKQLAEQSGTSVNTLRSYETGERKPKPDQLLKISEALGISINTFMDFDIKTISDLLSLIFKMDEQLDLRLEVSTDDQGQPDPNSIKLSFGNETVNQKLLTYILAKQTQEEFISSHDADTTPQYAETLANMEYNLTDLRNHLLDDNTIIQKNVPSPDISNIDPVSTANSPQAQTYFPDIFSDCSPLERKFITEMAQIVKTHMRDMNVNEHSPKKSESE